MSFKGFQHRNNANRNHSNQADLHLLEEMGITPDRSFRERRPTIKTVGLMIIFTTRMKRLAGAWSEKKKVQEQLVRKLDMMKGRGQRKRLPLGTR